MTDKNHYPRIDEPEYEQILKGMQKTSDVYSSLSDEGTSKAELGKLSGNSYEVTQDGINKIKNHIASNGFDAVENTEMIKRLETALQNGQKITGADASFYLHELKEAEQMTNMSYDAAHQAALEFCEVSPYSVYYPDVIQQNAEWFGKGWFEFWGIK